MMNKPIKAIEERIASTLAAADDVKSADLAALIQEVETAAQAADEAANKAREQALDPAVVVDAAKVGAAVASATLVRDRLQAALPRLHEQLKQAGEREYAAAWREDYAAVKARRDAVAQHLRERYPQLVEELVTLMASIAATDKEVDRINVAAPYGDHPRLRGTELTARGLDRLMQPEVSIPQELRLPTFHRDDGPVLAWPPRVPSLAETYVFPPALLVPVDVQRERLEANRRRHEESARLDALYQKREREAAQRREAELREAAGRP
jgi:hypothetical protein